MKPVNNTQSRFKNSPVAVTILQRVTFVSYTVARCKIWNVARLYGLRVASHHRRKIVGRRSWSVDTDFEAFDRFPSIDPSTDWSILARSGRLTNDRLELLDIGEMQLLLLVWIGNQGNVSDWIFLVKIIFVLREMIRNEIYLFYNNLEFVGQVLYFRSSSRMNCVNRRYSYMDINNQSAESIFVKRSFKRSKRLFYY